MRKKTALLLALFLTVVPVVNADSELQARIFDYFMTRANKGDRNAQYVVGERYETGLGTAKDIDKAHEWYVKAAAQGHALAKAKLDKRNQPAAPKEEAALPTKAAAPAGTDTREALERPAKMKKTIATKAVGKKKEREKVARVDPAAVQPAQPVTEPIPAPLATAAPAPTPVETAPVDAMDTVTNARWARGGRAAEILPSDLAVCLQASDAEMVCFSEKITRGMGNATVTYIVKSTLSRFTRDGGFTVNYIFNVLDIRNTREENSSSSTEEFSGMVMKRGWQEPGILLQCKIGDEKTLTCAGSGQSAIRFTKY